MDSSLSNPSSSLPRPVPTLQNKESADLLELLHGDLSNSSLGLDSDEDWIPLISNFCRYYLSKLPSPQGWKWDLLHEKTKLIETILDVVSRAITKPSLFTGHDSGAKVLFTTLVGLHYVLDQWCSVDVPLSDAVSSPQTLRGKVRDVIFELLQSLGNGSQLGEDKATTWVTLGSILSKCLSICDGAFPAACTSFSTLTKHQTTSTRLSNPTYRGGSTYSGPKSKGRTARFLMQWAIYCTSPLHFLTTEQEEDTVPDSISIRKASQLPLFLSSLNAIVLGALSPPMLCQDLLVHHTRRAVSTSRDLCDYFLSSSCSSPPPERIRAVSRILHVIQPFCRDGSGVEVASRAIQSRAILYRLEHNAQGGWDHFDAAFQEYVTGPVCTATDLAPIIDAVLSEEFPNGFQVRQIFVP